MIGRIYADNFRCLTNFELELDQTNIFLGPNGSGKTSVFDALRKIQNLTVRGARIEDEFPQRDLSCLRSDNQVLQFGDSCRSKLEIVVDQDSYEYMLQMKHNLDRNRLWIDQEILSHDKKPLFVHEKGIARLYRDDYGRESSYQFDLTRSGIGFLHAHPDNKKLTRFKRELANMMIVSPCPPLFKSECSTVTRTEAVFFDPMMQNFVEWYWSVSQKDIGSVVRLFEELRQVLPGFESLSMVESGENARVLKATFHSRSGDHRLNRRSIADPVTTGYSFSQLSDGQRFLVALYALLHLVEDDHLSEGHRRSLFIDEPDNYLSLREVQPWLAQVVDACGETLEQAVLVSHHPKTIDYLTGAKGRWFSRDGEGPVRVGTEPKLSTGGLSLSEAIARGWEE